MPLMMKIATSASRDRLEQLIRARRLEAPSGRTTRPTTDRAREAWMSVIHPSLDGARVLDGVTFVARPGTAVALVGGSGQDAPALIGGNDINAAISLASGTLSLTGGNTNTYTGATVVGNPVRDAIRAVPPPAATSASRSSAPETGRCSGWRTSASASIRCTYRG